MLQELVAERQATAVKLAGLDAQIVIALAALHQSVVPQDTDLLDAKTAAKRLGISPVYLYELSRQKKIPCVRIGRSVRYKPSDITNYTHRRQS